MTNKTPQTYYKIRQASTGLYSSGGAMPTFKKFGKIWTLPLLKAHLRMLQSYTKDFRIYEGCELVVFTEIVESANISLTDLIKPLEEDLIVNKLKGKI